MDLMCLGGEGQVEALTCCAVNHGLFQAENVVYTRDDFKENKNGRWNLLHFTRHLPFCFSIDLIVDTVAGFGHNTKHAEVESQIASTHIMLLKKWDVDWLVQIVGEPYAVVSSSLCDFIHTAQIVTSCNKNQHTQTNSAGNLHTHWHTPPLWR